MVFLDQVEFLAEAILHLLNKFSAIISDSGTSRTLGQLHLLQGGIVIIGGVALFLCNMGTRGGSKVRKVLLIKFELGSTIPGIMGGHGGWSGYQDSFHWFELCGQSFSILDHGLGLYLVEVVNLMAFHCECIQMAFPGKLFEKLVTEFLPFVGNWILSQKDESSLGSHTYCRLNTVKDSTTI